MATTPPTSLKLPIESIPCLAATTMTDKLPVTALYVLVLQLAGKMPQLFSYEHTAPDVDKSFIDSMATMHGLLFDACGEHRWKAAQGTTSYDLYRLS